MTYCNYHDYYFEDNYNTDFTSLNLSIIDPRNIFTLIIYFGVLFVFLHTLYNLCTQQSGYLKDCESDSDDLSESFFRDWPYSKVYDIPHPLDDRMKYFEVLSRQIKVIDPEYPFLVRIDGNNFSSFTSELKKITGDDIFSRQFRDTMFSTGCDLLCKFKPTTVYTHSDEITLIFPPTNLCKNGKKSQHFHGGKVYKILSLISASASSSFYKNLLKQFDGETRIAVEKLLSKLDIAFDSRLIVFPIEKTYEIGNNLIWRTRDCIRNYISAYAQKFLTKSQLHGVNSEKRICLLKNKGIDLTDESNLSFYDLSMKYGLVLKLAPIPHNKISTRVIYAYYAKKLQWSEDFVDFLLTKFQNNRDNFNFDEIFDEILQIIKIVDTNATSFV
jgi:tRNA(His) 5'-end guanylyltransferase